MKLLSLQYLQWQEIHSSKRHHHFKDRKEKAFPHGILQKNKKGVSGVSVKSSWVCRLTVITSLSLDFLVCNMIIIIIPTVLLWGLNWLICVIHLELCQAQHRCYVSIKYYYCCVPHHTPTSLREYHYHILSTRGPDQVTYTWHAIIITLFQVRKPRFQHTG